MSALLSRFARPSAVQTTAIAAPASSAIAPAAAPVAPIVNAAPVARRAVCTADRRALLARLRTAAQGDAVRVSVNGTVDVSTLFNSRQSMRQTGIDSKGAPCGPLQVCWSIPDWQLSTRDDWERSGDVCAVLDDAAQAVKLLAKSKADTVQLELIQDGDGAEIVLRAGAAEFTLSATDPDNFPEPKPLQTDSVVLVDAAELRRILAAVEFCCDLESTRYALGGVQVELTAEGITCAATDSRRLAKIDAPAQACEGFAPGVGVIPAGAVRLALAQLKDTDGGVALAIGVNEFAIEAPAWTLRGKLMAGRFPNWRQVIPSGFNHYVKADRTEFLEAWETAALCTNAESRGIDLRPTAHGLTLHAAGNGKAQISVEADHAYDGDAVESITFDGRYMIEYLKRCDAPEVVLALVDGESAAVIECAGAATYVLMPLA